MLANVSAMSALMLVSATAGLLLGAWLARGLLLGDAVHKESRDCTLATCYDVLGISLTGDVPPEFIIKAETPTGQTFIVHCLPREASAGEAMAESYALGDPQLLEAAQGSPVVGMCPSTGGRVAVYKTLDGAITQVNVQCHSSEYFTVAYTCGVRSAIFRATSPDEVTITVYHGGEATQKTVRPEYKLFYPNGPDCEPTCKTGRVTVSLP